MAEYATITAFDGLASPTSHTFIKDEVARIGNELVTSYKENKVSVPDIAQGRIRFKRAKSKVGVYHNSMEVVLPYMETTSGGNAEGYIGAPKVAYEDKIVIMGHFSNRSTLAGRKALRQMVVNIMNGVSTTVTPVGTACPFIDTIDDLVTPT